MGTDIARPKKKIIKNNKYNTWLTDFPKNFINAFRQWLITGFQQTKIHNVAFCYVSWYGGIVSGWVLSAADVQDVPVNDKCSPYQAHKK